jgi:hypothetical protein
MHGHQTAGRCAVESTKLEAVMAVYAIKLIQTSLSSSKTNHSPFDFIPVQHPRLSKLLRTAISWLEGSLDQSLKEAIDKTMSEVN